METRGLSFLAIDFETATARQGSVCEVGICAVRRGEVMEKCSWLVQPEGNAYSRWNVRIHGIRPEDTASAPDFRAVWEGIERVWLDEFDMLVAHNAAFDRSCLEQAARAHHLHLPPLRWECSLRAARRAFGMTCNKLGYLCSQLGIPEGQHHRAGDDAEMCARLYLRAMQAI